MANKIKLLPELVINQIAAGEVIDRPASIVKELAENSLDAHAGKIEIEVEQGGKSLVRVADDGEGMGREDALMALERHATSKIAKSADLFAIVSMGFRGEALPSIAAVSEMSIVTRPREAVAGTAIKIEAGRIRSVSDAGAPPGTEITVRRLFANLPARRKFMKSAETEIGHVTTLAANMALARPDVHFALTHNGKPIFDLPASSDLSGRLRHALGADAMSQLIAVDRTIQGPQDLELRVHGFISAPSYNRASTRSLHSFVNRRFVRDRLVNHAVFEAYRNLLPKGRYPLVVLFIDLPTHAVDVNVHPAKHEIRFREQNWVHESVVEALRDALRQGDRRGRSWDAAPREPAPGPQYDHRAGVEDALRRFEARPEREAPVHERGFTPPVGFDNPPRNEAEAAPAGPPPSLKFSELRVIGQFADSFILAESPDSLVLIDQHAAHERVAFERLMREFREGAVLRQPLLFPVTVDLTYQEAQRVAGNQETIAGIGLIVEPFGGNTVVVKELPALLAGTDPEKLLLEIADRLTDINPTLPLHDRLSDIFAVMACHSVVRANKPMSIEEMRALLSAMDGSDHPGHCPHGRDVVVRIGVGEIRKRFGR